MIASNMGKTISYNVINHPFVNSLYNLCLMIWGMVYGIVSTHITKVSNQSVDPEYETRFSGTLPRSPTHLSSVHRTLHLWEITVRYVGPGNLLICFQLAFNLNIMYNNIVDNNIIWRNHSNVMGTNK